MQIAQGQHDVGGIEFCGLLLKASNLLQIEKEFASGAVVEYEIEVSGALEGIMHS